MQIFFKEAKLRKPWHHFLMKVNARLVKAHLDFSCSYLTKMEKRSKQSFFNTDNEIDCHSKTVASLNLIIRPHCVVV